MAEIQNTGTVTVIQARRQDVLFGMTPQINDPTGTNLIRLEYNHPGYSTIYTMLVQSAANGRKILVDAIDTTENGEDHLTVEWVNYNYT